MSTPTDTLGRDRIASDRDPSAAGDDGRRTVERRLGLAVAHLELLFPDSVGLVELRARHTTTGRWTQRFRPATELAAVARLAMGLAPTHEVYVGVLPRAQESGRRADLLPTGSTVWVDLDSATATERVRTFAPAPSLLLSSGSPGHAHAYWTLDRSLAVARIEAINRALADRVGGDPASFDAPRILRLAGTLAHKTEPPLTVAPLDTRAGSGPSTGERPYNVADHRGLVLTDASGRVSTTGLLRLLPTDTTAASRPARDDESPQGTPPQPTTAHETVPPRDAAPPRGSRVVGAAQRRLEALSPEVYVPALTGLRVRKDRKVRCPLHEDRTPSLHVYPTAEEGWFCFGCRRGGRVYDLAAALWDRPLRGHAFVELRDDLLDLLVPDARPR